MILYDLLRCPPVTPPHGVDKIMEKDVEELLNEILRRTTEMEQALREALYRQQPRAGPEEETFDAFDSNV